MYTLKNIRDYLRKKDRVRCIQKGTKYFQLINFSHSKSSEIAFFKLSWRIKLE